MGAPQRSAAVEEILVAAIKNDLKMETRFLAVSLLDRYLDLKSRPVLGIPPLRPLHPPSSSSSSCTAFRCSISAGFCNRASSDVKQLAWGGKPMTETGLDLVACAALLIAVKYEESYQKAVAMSVNIFARALQLGALSKKVLVELEFEVLSVLKCDINAPTMHSFLARYVRAGLLNAEECTLASLLAERCLCEHAMIRHLPSTQAAAVVSLTRQVVRGRSPWSPTLFRYTLLSHAEIADCASAIQSFLQHEEAQRLARSAGQAAVFAGDGLRSIYQDRWYSLLVTLPSRALVTPVPYDDF